LLIIDEMIVTRIMDGDTIAVKKDLKDLKETRIRFKCVDAPEKSQVRGLLKIFSY
jgi:endonuclease YncB( thermonuclease family)